MKLLCFITDIHPLNITRVVNLPSRYSADEVARLIRRGYHVFSSITIMPVAGSQ